jgi:hypothetical protein
MITAADTSENWGGGGGGEKKNGCGLWVLTQFGNKYRNDAVNNAFIL